MPVFINPARVEITEGGSSAAVAAVAALAVTASGLAAVLSDIITALAIAAAVAVAGSLVVLLVVLRRNTGGGLWRPESRLETQAMPSPAAVAGRPARAELAGPAVRLIEVRPAETEHGVR